MKNAKKPYAAPSVVKVEFDVEDRITASLCDNDEMLKMIGIVTDNCMTV